MITLFFSGLWWISLEPLSQDVCIRRDIIKMSQWSSVKSCRRVPEPDYTHKQAGLSLVLCLYKVLTWLWQCLELNLTLSSSSLRTPVGLDDVFDCPPADGAACVGHLLQFEAAGVAETHVSTGVQDRVHHILVANGALITPRAGREGRGFWMAGERRARGCTCGGRKQRVVVGIKAWVEVDVHWVVEVGLGVATAKHDRGVWCTRWGAGHRWASKVRMQRRA